ncbi:MAG: class I SAM-dependent methyltransferase [Candidatus Marinimicrobia bacterium]|nr:class I SAM-dependent methyltransferase [Candidatus Neomarinimicrobiota bacterium]
MADNYSLTAKLYDPLLHMAIRPIRQAVLQELADNQQDAIVDLCCGTGNQMKLLTHNGFTDLHCVDLSPEMLAIAKQGDYPINIYERDATATGFDNGRFDADIISFALHEKERSIRARLLTEAHRILKPVSRLLIVDYVFDDRTKLSARYAISLVEWIAGDDHYLNFKDYITNGGLPNLVDPGKFICFKATRILLNSVIFSVYRKR